MCARLAPGREAVPWILRFYDVTSIHFDGTNAHGYFDVPVDLAPGNWYVQVWEAEKTYFAEIGPRTPEGRLIPVCRSNFVSVPRADVSSHYGPQWLSIDIETGQANLVEEPSPDEATAMAPEPDHVVAMTPAQEPEYHSPRDFGAREPEIPQHPAEFSPEPEPEPVLPPPCESATPEESWSVLPAGDPEAHGYRTIPSSESVSSFGLGSGGAAFPSERTAAADRQSVVAAVVDTTAREHLRGDSKWVESGESGGFVLRSIAADEPRSSCPPEGLFPGKKRERQDK